jgi:hypothetical protein
MFILRIRKLWGARFAIADAQPFMHRKFPQVSCCLCFLLLSIDLHRLSKNHCADAGVGCIHTPHRVGDADPVHRGWVGMSPIPYTATGRIPYGKYTVTCRTVSHPLMPFLFAHRYGIGASTAVVRPCMAIRYNSHFTKQSTVPPEKQYALSAGVEQRERACVKPSNVNAWVLSPRMRMRGC